jgi:hypothetical protein
MRNQPVAEAATYTVHNKHKRRLAGFESAIQTVKWPQTYALERRSTEVYNLMLLNTFK